MKKQKDLNACISLLRICRREAALIQRKWKQSDTRSMN